MSSGLIIITGSNYSRVSIVLDIFFTSFSTEFALDSKARAGFEKSYYEERFSSLLKNKPEILSALKREPRATITSMLCKCYATTI